MRSEEHSSIREHEVIVHEPIVGGTQNDENEPDWGDQHENFDEIYENTDESELGDVQQQHGSVLMHLLSQVFLKFV